MTRPNSYDPGERRRRPYPKNDQMVGALEDLVGHSAFVSTARPGGGSGA